MARSSCGGRCVAWAWLVGVIASRDCGACMASKRAAHDGFAWWLNTISLRRRRRTACSRSSWPPRPIGSGPGDLTAIATRAGWVYLAVILDLYSRRVIGWAMSARPDQQVALTALQMALTHRRPRPGLIHHTDQGATYTSVAYQRQLRQTGLVASMSRKGNCYDNAVVESFFSTLKNELVHEQDFHTREEAQAAVFEFIEVFYNRQRLHQTLGYVSPVQFEAAHVP